MVGEQEGDDLGILHRAFHRRLGDDEEVDRRDFARRQHRDARRRLDAFHLQLVRIEAFLAHHRAGDVGDVAAGVGADLQPLEVLQLGDVGSRVEREETERSLLIDDGHDLDGRAFRTRNDEARHVDEADLRDARTRRSEFPAPCPWPERC